MRVVRLLGLAVVAMALATTALARLWPAVPEETGLRLRLEALAADGQSRVIGGSPASWPSARSLEALTGLDLSRTFRATWEGVLHVSHPGVHVFNTRSDDGSQLWIGDVLVVDNGGVHGLQRRSGAIDLPRGVHRVRVLYEQHGGDYALDVTMRQPGGTSRRLETFALAIAPADRPAGEWTLRRIRSTLSPLVVGAWLAVYGMLLLAVGTYLFRAVERRVSADRAGWPLGLSLALLAAVATCGIGWGLPSDFDGWASDEVAPFHLYHAMAHHFRPPWSSLYPPLQFYLLAPIAWLTGLVGSLVGIEPWTSPGVTYVHLGMRGLSVLMSAGILGSVYLIVRQCHDRAAALVAVWIAGCGLTFLYYAKVANVDVPYLYWTFLALTVFTRFVMTGDVVLIRWIAVCAALAVATKDQAAGFFMLMAPTLPLIAIHHARRAGVASPIMHVLRRRIWLEATALMVLALAIVYQWPFAPDSVTRHLENVRAGRYAPMTPGTVAGHVRLFLWHGELLTFMLGPAVAVLAIAGAVRCGLARQWQPLVAVGVPLLSYLVGFLAVVRYTYDRFLLGVALLMVCLAAPAAVAAWRSVRYRPLVRGVLLLCAAWTLGHGLTVNTLMRNDSRDTVGDVLARRSDATQHVGMVSPRQYQPHVDDQPSLDVPLSVDAVRAGAPRWLVVNSSYLARFRHDEAPRALRQALDSGTLGYRLVDTWRTAPPRWAVAWWWPHFHQRAAHSFTNLDKINPQIELWERVE